jgi:predicted GIY-YIG superfamily endonuclease
MVYLIHFDEPFKHAEHYLGYSKDENFLARIEHHRKGTGSALMRAVKNAGIGWNVVRQWPGMDGNFEQALKKKGYHSKLLCPICNPQKYLTYAANVNRTETSI